MKPYTVVISCELDLHLDVLKKRMWEAMGFYRCVSVYTKKRGETPDLVDPLIIKTDATTEASPPSTTSNSFGGSMLPNGTTASSPEIADEDTEEWTFFDDFLGGQSGSMELEKLDEAPLASIGLNLTLASSTPPPPRYRSDTPSPSLPPLHEHESTFAGLSVAPTPRHSSPVSGMATPAPVFSAPRRERQLQPTTSHGLALTPGDGARSRHSPSSPTADDVALGLEGGKAVERFEGALGQFVGLLSHSSSRFAALTAPLDTYRIQDLARRVDAADESRARLLAFQTGERGGGRSSRRDVEAGGGFCGL
ncbi:hypothetical protein JCM10207_002932 [Rhodosporidiobolus poonsookiae]